MVTLKDWLASISCGSVEEPLDIYGVETVEDLLLLDPEDIEVATKDLKKVQLKKFTAALESLRGGGAAAPAEPSTAAPATAPAAAPATAPAAKAAAEAEVNRSERAEILVGSTAKTVPEAKTDPAALNEDLPGDGNENGEDKNKSTSANDPLTQQAVGETIYPLICADDRVADGETAGKITGMILGGFSIEVLGTLMDGGDELKAKISEALDLLEAAAGLPAEAEPEAEPEPPAEDDEATIVLKRKSAIGLGKFKFKLASGPAELSGGSSIDAASLVETEAFKVSVADFMAIYPGWNGAMNLFPPGSGEERTYDVEWECSNTDGGLRVDKNVTVYNFRQIRTAMNKMNVTTPDKEEFGSEGPDSANLMWSAALLMLNYETVGDGYWDRLLGEMMDNACAAVEELEAKPVVWETMKVPNHCVGLIIGKNGATIKRICQESGAYVEVQEDGLAKGGVREVYMCEDNGGEGSVLKARDMIEQMVKDEAKKRAERQQRGSRGRGRGRSKGRGRGSR
eukprot:COSAG05_NODE_72_length_21963_cov_153.494535_13_plen_512_part_00